MAIERLIGNAAIDQVASIAGQSRALAWKWKTSAADKRATGIFVRVPAAGAFATGCKAVWWDTTTPGIPLQVIDIGGLGGAPGAWVRVPGFTAAAIVANRNYLTAVYHPSTDPGGYYFKSAFGNPVSGTLSGNSIFTNGAGPTGLPADETFTAGAFGIDVEIDDVTPVDPDDPPPPPVVSGDLWIWGDAVLATLNILRAAHLPVGSSPVTFGTRRPRAKTFDPTLPYVLVANDGESGRTIADQSANVRVTVWAKNEEQARLIASWARAVLLASHGDGVNVRHFSRQLGMLPAEDPNSGAPLCSFTVAARLRPVQLSTQE